MEESTAGRERGCAGGRGAAPASEHQGDGEQAAWWSQGGAKNKCAVGGEGGQLRTVTAVVEDSSEGVYE